MSNQLPELKQININHSNIGYYEQGEGEVIILLHGWPQTSYVWRNIFPDLSKKFRVIAIDLPGLGKSDPTNKYDTKSIAFLLDEIVTTLNITKCHLVGHDIGGWIAASYAIYFEESLHTLTILDAGIPGLMNPQVFQPENANKIWQFYFHAVDEIPEFLVDGKEKEYLSWYFTKKSFIKEAINENDLLEYYIHYKGRMKNGFDYYRAFSLSSDQNKLFNSMLKIPVLAIGGETAMSNNVGLAMSSIASNVQSISFKNCGHYIPEEQPSELIKILMDFIKD